MLKRIISLETAIKHERQKNKELKAQIDSLNKVSLSQKRILNNMTKEHNFDQKVYL